MLETVTLSQDYYLENFFRLIHWVLEKYEDLLTEKEIQYGKDILSWPRDASRLYVRLILRTGPYFRKDKLSYAEIESLTEAIRTLENHGYLQVGPDFELEEIWSLFTKPEWVDILGKWTDKRIPKSIKKEDLLEMADEMSFVDIKSDLLNEYEILWPLKQEEMWLYRLLFFGNLYQDMSEFLLEDLGVQKFEPYEIRKEDRTFQSRKSVDQILELSDWWDSLYQAIEEDNLPEVIELKESLIKIKPVDGFVERRQMKAWTYLGRVFEKYQFWDAALSCYELSVCPPARERRIRTLEKLGKLEEAVSLCDQLVLDGPDVTEQEFLRHFPTKLHKKLGRSYPSTTRPKYQTVNWKIKQNFEAPVEVQTLNFYEARGWQGIYTENRMWNALFSLLIWEPTFQSAPGAFHHPFQRGPNDFLSATFYPRRKDHIEAHLDHWERISRNGHFVQNLEELYQAKYLTAHQLLSWKNVPFKDLKTAIQVIPFAQIRTLLERWLQHPGKHSSGFPDLFLWKNSEYLLVEVKSPNDQLQSSQKGWLQFFNDHNIPYEVAKIAWL